MNTYRFYVGSNNATHRPDRPALVKALTALGIDGFTLTPAVGYWHGQPEQSTVVDVVGELDAQHVAHELEQRLAQDLVLATVNGKPLEAAHA